MAANEISSFFAAISGALVGGSLTIASQTFFEARRQALSRRTLGTSLFFKVQRIHSNRVNLHNWLVEGRNSASEHKINLSGATSGIPNLVSPIEFTSEEKALTIEFNDVDLLNTISSLDHLHNTFILLPRRFTELKEAFHSTVEIDGHKGLAALVDLRRLSPKQRLAVLEMDDLLEDTYAISMQDTHDAEFALRALAVQLKRYCRVKIDLD